MGERHTRRQFVRRGSAAALVVASTPALLTASASANRRRLRAIKRSYDPRERFGFAQG